MPIGTTTKAANTADLALTAREYAELLPRLLVEAKRIANNVVLGIHGRRQRGTGEDFWQFRPYIPGETIANIDWRRSARDDQNYVRDREFEAAQTVWIWPDQTASMNFCSRHGQRPKAAHALLLSFVIGNVMVKNGEHIAIPALMQPTAQRNAIENMALAFLKQQQNPTRVLPDFSQLGRFCHCVIISDFLDDIALYHKQLSLLAQRNIHAHLIEVADPAEERFPYNNCIEFRDPETGAKLYAGRAETLQQDYKKMYHARRKQLKDYCHAQGWSYTTSYTDQPLSQTLMHLSQAFKATDR